MNYKKFKKELLESDKDLKREYEKRDIALEISKIIIEARIFKGLTQERLAKRMGTKQPSIARIENGNLSPNLGFLEKIALAMGAHLEIPRFNFDKTIEIKTQAHIIDKENIATMIRNCKSDINIPVSASGNYMQELIIGNL
jgi:transcriptional regulator with XRE-family HTH domain